MDRLDERALRLIKTFKPVGHWCAHHLQMDPEGWSRPPEAVDACPGSSGSTPTYTCQCTAENVDHPEYLLRLAELELIDRHQRMVERRIRAARFPAVKSLDTFDFPAIGLVNKALVVELARCE